MCFCPALLNTPRSDFVSNFENLLCTLSCYSCFFFLFFFFNLLHRARYWSGFIWNIMNWSYLTDCQIKETLWLLGIQAIFPPNPLYIALFMKDICTYNHSSPKPSRFMCFLNEIPNISWSSKFASSL